MCPTHSLMAACCVSRARLQDLLQNPGILSPVPVPGPALGNLKAITGLPSEQSPVPGCSFCHVLHPIQVLAALPERSPMRRAAGVRALDTRFSGWARTLRAARHPMQPHATLATPRSAESPRGFLPHCHPRRCLGLSLYCRPPLPDATFSFRPRVSRRPQAPGFSAHRGSASARCQPRRPCLPGLGGPGSDPEAEAWFPVGQTVGRSIAKRFRIAASTRRARPRLTRMPRPPRATTAGTHATWGACARERLTHAE